MSEHDYSIEDAYMASCSHEQTFIMWTRYCNECGAIVEEQILEPGSESITHHHTHIFEAQP